MTAVDDDEAVVAFSCEAQRLWGVLSRPPADAPTANVAVLIVVGGPQYRVGSHRQFVLLARGLARAGFFALRFDYRGMGDSDGDARDFKAAGPDIRAALDALAAQCPNVQRFVVWGLCDAASAALMHAATDPRVVGIVAANPWVRSDASLATTRIRHYYTSRLVDREFWAKLLRGGLRWGPALRSFAGTLRDAFVRKRSAAAATQGGSFQDAMARGLAALRGRLLLVLANNDLTAQEFVQFTATDPAWRRLLSDAKVTRHEMADADHTFSRRVWQDEVEAQTITWLRGLDANARMTSRLT